nr:ribonuclease H [Ipomoea batatas]
MIQHAMCLSSEHGVEITGRLIIDTPMGHTHTAYQVNVAPEIPNVAAFGAYEQYADFSDFGASISPNYYTSGDTSTGTPLPIASHPAESPERCHVTSKSTHFVNTLDFETVGNGILEVTCILRSHVSSKVLTPSPRLILRLGKWDFRGVYDNWNEAKAQVHRFSDNLYKSFASKEEAIQAFDNFVANQMGSSLNAGALSCSSQTTNTTRTTSNSDEAKDILSCVQDELARVKLPDAQGDDGDRQPSDDNLIYVPTMFSIPSEIGLDKLSGCRALLIDVVEFCSHPGSLIFFIYDTPTDNDEVEVIYENSAMHFNNFDPNYKQSYDALEHLLEYSVHVPTMNYLVLLNLERFTCYF